MNKRNPLLSNYVAITTDGRVELAENKDTKFKRFWKQIAGYGDFVDPRGTGKKMILDREWANRIVDNFKNGPIKRVPTPIGHPQNSSELAEMNKGWLVDAEARDDGLYGLMEIRKQDAADDIENGVLVDTSVAFDEEYTDKKTGKVFRDVLKHVGLVNDPYIKDMTEFQPALSDGNLATVLFSDENQASGNNNKEENTMGVKNDREFAVEVTYTENEEEKKVTVQPGEEVLVPYDQADAVKQQITDATAPTTENNDGSNGATAENSDKDKGEKHKELSDDEKAAKELSDREASVKADREALDKRAAEYAKKDAEAEYERLLSEGKLVPAQKDTFIALSLQKDASVELSDGEKKTIAVLMSELFEAAPKLNLTDEEGKDGEGSKSKEDEVELSDEDKAMAGRLNISEEDMLNAKKESRE